MAFPIVRSTAANSESGNTTSHAILLPTPIYEGDLLLAFFSNDGSDTVTWDNTTAGTWTLQSTVANGSANRLTIYAKVADGTEDSKTLTITTSGSQQSVSRVLCVQNWEGTLSGGLNCPTAATGTDNSPNPPTATDSWGTVDRKTIAVYGNDFSRTTSTYASGYTLNQFNDVSGGGAGCGLASAGRNANEGLQDPGVFTMSASDQWVAATLSILGGDWGDPKIMLDGTETSAVLTPSNSMFTKVVTSASYPSNAAGIGVRSSGGASDTYLYECGVMVAFIPAGTMKPGIARPPEAAKVLWRAASSSAVKTRNEF